MNDDERRIKHAAYGIDHKRELKYFKRQPLAGPQFALLVHWTGIMELIGFMESDQSDAKYTKTKWWWILNVSEN